jgi:hypothetical protein
MLVAVAHGDHWWVVDGRVGWSGFCYGCLRRVWKVPEVVFIVFGRALSPSMF